MATTANLGLTLLDENDVLKYVIINQALEKFDGFLTLTVVDSTTTTPPGVPGDNNKYRIAATATGDWAGKEGQIAWWTNGAWNYTAPFEGLSYIDATANIEYTYINAAWVHTAFLIPRTLQLNQGHFIQQALAVDKTNTLTSYKAQVWEFANGTVDSIVSTFALPKHANYTDINVRIYGAPRANTAADDLRFNITVYNTEDGEDLDAATSVTQSFTYATSTPAQDELLVIDSGQFDLNSVVTEDSLLVMKIERESTHAADLFDQDFYLYHVVIEYVEKITPDAAWS